MQSKSPTAAHFLPDKTNDPFSVNDCYKKSNV